MQTLVEERGCGNFGMGLWQVFQIRLIITSNCTNQKKKQVNACGIKMVCVWIMG